MKFSVLRLKMRFILLVLLIISFKTQAQTEHIKIYFNHPVDTTVATGPEAVNLHGKTLDTLAAYINCAKYSVDVAQYDYIYYYNTSSIAVAIDSAYARGVKVRWIYDGSGPNTGLEYLDSGIYTLGSPVSPDYGIMHHKFVVIDAHSNNANDPVVWTGSMDWNYEQVSGDYNNTVIIQDSALALAYTAQFNEMWGDTGLIPDTINSRFGPYKTDTTQHHFVIDGIHIELYFSPVDGTDTYIVNAINSANSDLYFGVYTFTEPTASGAIKSKIESGVYALGIIDQYSTLYGSADSILNTVMDSSTLIVYAQDYTVYHSKYLIVDPCDFSSNPIVATGSHNWTWAANNLNDENELIFHDSTIANIYYQSFLKDFTTLGGTVSACNSLINTGINDVSNAANIKIYSNPSSSAWQLNIDGDLVGGWYELYDMGGKMVLKSIINSSATNISASLEQGVYIIKVHLKQKSFVQKLIKL